MDSILPSRDLVSLIERHAAELTEQWLEFVQTDPRTTTYHTFDKDELRGYAMNVYGHLGRWLSRDTTKEDIAQIYTALGKKRHAQGFKLSEVIHALVLTRRVLWFKILSEGLLDTAPDLDRAMDLNNHTIVFFDRALFYIAKGYELPMELISQVPPKKKSRIDRFMESVDVHWRF